MKCQAKTSEGTACKFNASAEVGGGHFCGNHANIARATQLKSSAPQSAKTREQKVLTPEADYQARMRPLHEAVQGVKDAVRDTDAPMNAEQVLTVIALMMDQDLPRKLCLQTLNAWKAGQL